MTWSQGQQSDWPEPGRNRPGKWPSERVPVRRRIHLSTVVTLVLSVPWFVCSLFVVGTAAHLAASNNPAVVWAAPLVFVASGAAAFFMPTEYVIARWMFRLRRPTVAEQHRLDQAWGAVAAAAGIRPEQYQLWVHDTSELNAFATAGHIVAVTRMALDRLAPPHLAAVLAHELGHHVGGHSWASLLAQWYSLPGRVAAQVLFRVTGFAFGFVSGCVLGPLVRLFPLLFLAGVTWVLYSIHPALVLVWVIPIVLAWFGRYGEKYADRMAAELGYGPQLEVAPLSTYLVTIGSAPGRLPLSRLARSTPRPARVVLD